MAGGALLGAGRYPLAPLKQACLRHCRSPMGFFLRSGRRMDGPWGAVRAGVIHGTFCLG